MDREIKERAHDLARVFKRPWWKFWRRDYTEQEAETAIRAALMGDHKPIQMFGIAIPARTPTQRVMDIIRNQGKHFWR